MISRRAFLIGATVLATPLAGAAQQRSVVPRLGVLAQDVQPGLLETLRDELERLGYVEGKGIVTEVRNADGRSDRLPALVGDLLRLKVDVIVAVNTPAAKAAQNATKAVPIVIMRVADPVKAGLVRSLAHPGANVTGVSFLPDVLGAKSIEALSQVVPGLSRVAAFYKGDNPGALLVVTETERRSAELGVRFERFPVRDPSDFPAMTHMRAPFLKLSSQRSLPVASIYKDFAEAGGLFAYGPDLDHVYRRAAYYVARVLKGAKPSELPVEQADRLHFVVNLKSAKALGLTIPPALLLRANQVIE
jgi:putative ABC transport system substrate-binding protein